MRCSSLSAGCPLLQVDITLLDKGERAVSILKDLGGEWIGQARSTFGDKNCHSHFRIDCRLCCM